MNFSAPQLYWTVVLLLFHRLSTFSTTGEYSNSASACLNWNSTVSRRTTSNALIKFVCLLIYPMKFKIINPNE